MESSDDDSEDYVVITSVEYNAGAERGDVQSEEDDVQSEEADDVIPSRVKVVDITKSPVK